MGNRSTPESTESTESGSPTAGATGTAARDRFSADGVFAQIIDAADEEITSGTRKLYFSGVAAGFTIAIAFPLFASLTGPGRVPARRTGESRAL